MEIRQRTWTPDQGWQPECLESAFRERVEWVFVFSSSNLLKRPESWAALKQAYPKAHFFGCSTAGEICGSPGLGDVVLDDTLVVTAVHFEHTRIVNHSICLRANESSLEAGERLGQLFETEGLVHLFVLSDGLQVNGSELVRGISRHLPDQVTITGGLSGDGDRFQETWVICEDQPFQGALSALGFYGDCLKVGYGSLGGWTPFGPERKITQSCANTLYKLDGKPALELYKTYLGEHADGLPATGLLFPLSLCTRDGERLVRTILSVNEAEQSLTFAGDMPEGSFAQFMHASVERLVDGAIGAAETSLQAIDRQPPELALLVSCVGRKLLLKQRIEEEVEGVREVTGEQATLAGFYSYGEISPFSPGAPCKLHNQTMTITLLSEN